MDRWCHNVVKRFEVVVYQLLMMIMHEQISQSELSIIVTCMYFDENAMCFDIKAHGILI